MYVMTMEHIGDLTIKHADTYSFYKKNTHRIIKMIQKT